MDQEKTNRAAENAPKGANQAAKSPIKRFLAWVKVRASAVARCIRRQSGIITLFFEAVLCFAVVYQAIVAARQAAIMDVQAKIQQSQLIIMGNQVKIMERQTGMLNDQTKATKSSADTSKMALAHTLEQDQAAIILSGSANISDPLVSEKPVSIHLALKNNGGSEAVNVTFLYWTAILGKNERPSDPSRKQVVIGKMGRGEERSLEVQTIQILNDQEVKDITMHDGPKRLFFYGQVDVVKGAGLPFWFDSVPKEDGLHIEMRNMPER